MTLYLIDYELGSPREFKDLALVIDGANVAYETLTNDNKARIMNLEIMQQKLEDNGIIDYKVICDRSLFYNIDDREKYNDLIMNDNRFIEAPGGAQADPFILQYTSTINGWILSNDNFKDFHSLFGKEWIQNRRISFRIIDEEIYFDRLIPNNNRIIKEVN
ncbi:MAG: hypothetical protein ACFE88_13855 [Candidatus Hermodarchaeota archaeon]